MWTDCFKIILRESELRAKLPTRTAKHESSDIYSFFTVPQVLAMVIMTIHNYPDKLESHTRSDPYYIAR
jgi:hypothetical protein